MKCPVTPNPTAAAIIKSRDLVYVGMGSESAPLFKGKGIMSLCMATRGRQDGGLRDNEGFVEDAYYFVSRKDAAKYFPETTRTKARYFVHTQEGGFTGTIAYFVISGKLGRFINKDGTKYKIFDPSIYTLDFALRDVGAGIWKEISESQALALITEKPTRKVAAKPARKVSPKPANHIVPAGYVYLGKTGEFKTSGRFDGLYAWAGEPLEEEKSLVGNGMGYYYVPINSEIARLNGLGPKIKRPSATATPKTALAASEASVAALQKENETLKSRLEKIEKIAKGS